MGGERRVLALRRADIGGSPEYRDADLAVKGDVIEIGPRGGKIVGHTFHNGKRVPVYEGSGGGGEPTLGSAVQDDAHRRGWSFPSASGWSVNRQAGGHSYEIQHRREYGDDQHLSSYEVSHVDPDNKRTTIGKFHEADDAKRAALRHDVERRGPGGGTPAPSPAAAKLSEQTAGSKVVSLADRRPPAEPSEPPKRPAHPDTTERHLGAKYDAGRDTAEVARLFREDVKRAIASGDLPKGLKLSVNTRKYSGGSSIHVEVQAAPGVQVGNPERHAHDAKYGPLGNPGERPPALLHADGAALQEKLRGLLRAYEKSAHDSGNDYYSSNFHPSVEFASELRKAPGAAAPGSSSSKADALREQIRARTGGVTAPAAPPSPALAKLAQQAAAGASPNVSSAAPPPRPAAAPPKPVVSQTLARQIAERRPTLEMGAQQTDLAGPPSRKTHVSAAIQQSADEIDRRLGSLERINGRTGEWSSREHLARYINAAERGLVELKGLMRRAESEGASGGNLGTRLLALQTNLRRAQGHLKDRNYRTDKPASESLPLFRGEPAPNRAKPAGGQGSLFGGQGGTDPRQRTLF